MQKLYNSLFVEDSLGELVTIKTSFIPYLCRYYLTSLINFSPFSMIHGTLVIYFSVLAGFLFPQPCSRFSLDCVLILHLTLHFHPVIPENYHTNTLACLMASLQMKYRVS